MVKGEVFGVDILFYWCGEIVGVGVIFNWVGYVELFLIGKIGGNCLIIVVFFFCIIVDINYYGRGVRKMGYYIFYLLVDCVFVGFLGNV